MFQPPPVGIKGRGYFIDDFDSTIVTSISLERVLAHSNGNTIEICDMIFSTTIF